MLRTRSLLSTISFAFVLFLSQTAGAAGNTPKLALIMDDICGGTWVQTKPLLEMARHIPMALSVLPNGSESCRQQVFKEDRGQSILMLHMPMQPTGAANPGPGAILTSDSPEMIRQKLDDALEAIPGALGVNNHMGSAASGDARVMAVVLQWAADRSLFYVDSATTPFKACTLATGAVACARNAVFLDHTESVQSVGKAIRRARILSVRTGQPVIVIGHPHPNTIRVLKEFIKLKRGEFVPIEQALPPG